MFKGSAAKVALRRIDELFHSGIAGDLSDSELLDRFLRCGDSAREFAFAALVERHGPMVFRVCGQALKNHDDVQDAVQATFLVLARRAGAIRKRTSVSSWLFGVARRAAGHIRMAEARRKRIELRAAERAIPVIDAALARREPDPYPELHAEIERLPEKYRLPIVLCYLEGLTHEQAASRLRWPLGTVKIRLSRARERLRVRLEERRKPYLLVMPVSSLHAGLPEHLVNSITQAGCGSATNGALGGLASAAVVQLTERVMKSMLFGKLKMAAVVLAGLFVLGLGGLVAAQHATRKDAPGQQRDGAIAKKNDSTGTLQVVGRTDFDPNMIVKIRPRFDCLVERVLVEVGQRVKKGDPLIELLSTDLAAAKNDFQTAKVQWDHDHRIYELKSRLATENSISQQELFDSRNVEIKSRLRLVTAREKLIILGVTEREIEDLGNPDAADRTDKARMTRRSSVDGVVIQRDVVPGNLYDRNAVLLIIAQDDLMRVVASVDEQDAHKVKVGQNVIVRFSFEDKGVNAKVDHVALSVDRETHKVRILATIPNPDHRRKSGTIVRVALLTDAQEKLADERGGPEELPADTPASDRLTELERKVDRLLGEKEERTAHAKILERLEAVERKLDQVPERAAIAAAMIAQGREPHCAQTGGFDRVDRRIRCKPDKNPRFSGRRSGRIAKVDPYYT